MYNAAAVGYGYTTLDARREGGVGRGMPGMRRGTRGAFRWNYGEIRELADCGADDGQTVHTCRDMISLAIDIGGCEC